MIERIGDIFKQLDADAICFTSNGIVKSNGELVMGAGIAKAFNDRYRWLAQLVGERVKLTGNHVYVFKHSDLNFHIASFPTKHHFRDGSDPNLIKCSAYELRNTADHYQWEHIYLTRPGCGLGGLDWIEVKHILEPVFDDRFIILTPR